MLVLSRKLAETLRIGDDIEVTILSVSGNQVRLGIVAPRDVVVDREEIYQRKKEASAAEQSTEEGNEAVLSRPAGRGNHPFRLHPRGPRLRH